MKNSIAALFFLSSVAAALQGADARSLLAAGAPPADPLAALTPPPPAPKPEHFIEIRDGQFVDGCNNFKLAGWNQWEVVEAAAGAPSLSGASIPSGSTGPALVRTLLRRGSALGFNVMRTWAHAVNAQYALQTAPGQFNEGVFQGLDYLLDEARQAGIKLILAFTSNWTPIGGLPEYVKWAGLSNQSDFFTSPDTKAMYKGFVEAVINRRNTINGRLYRDDPTIMAWDLLNEPRCEKCAPGAVARWYDEMATYARTLDPNHLITTGEEGFYGCCKNPGNPGSSSSEWAAEEGQNFVDDHSSPAINFATTHIWPDNWGDVTIQFQHNWLTHHVDDAQKLLNKPIVLEEWGKWVNVSANATLEDRTAFMKAQFDDVKAVMSTPNSPLQGSLFWQWYLEGQEGAPTEGGGRGLFGIYESDPVFALIKDNNAFIASLNTPIPGCQDAAHKAADVAPVDDCRATWVNGAPGTGMEGPRCDIPVNECVRGTAGCDHNAACIDTPAAYECRCYYGYTGDGKTCAPDPPMLKELDSMYWSEAGGLSCKEGNPVAWPLHSPGWTYDPLKSFQFFDHVHGGTLGSHTNVTLQQCKIACQLADACESFVYNDVLMQCFLATGQCPVYNYCQGEQAKCDSVNDRGGKFSFDCGFWTSYYRLDSVVAANCQGFTPNPLSVGTPKPEVLDLFAQYQAQHPGKVRTTPANLAPGEEVPFVLNAPPVAAAPAAALPAQLPAAPAAPAVPPQPPAPAVLPSLPAPAPTAAPAVPPPPAPAPVQAALAAPAALPAQPPAAVTSLSAPAPAAAPANPAPPAPQPALATPAAPAPGAPVDASSAISQATAAPGPLFDPTAAAAAPPVVTQQAGR